MGRHLRRLPPLLAAGAAVLAATEVLLRLLAPIPPGASVKIRGQTLPGLHPTVVYERNAWGLRSLSMKSEARPPGTIRILALGASTTDSPTQNAADAWWGLLETRLRDLLPPGTGVEVAAYGRGGAPAVHRLAWARGHLSRLDPDVVITLEGINDLAWHGGPGYRYRGLEAALRAVPKEEEDSCSSWSQVCRRLERLRRALRAARRARKGRTLEWHSRNLPRLARAYRALPAVARPERPVDPIREFGDAMEALLEELEARGVEAVVLGQPVLWKPRMSDEERSRLWFGIRTPGGPVRPDPAWLAAEMARYNRLQRELAGRHGAHYVDLPARVPSDLRHFIDDCHFTDEGSRAVAEAVLPEVLAAARRVLARRAAAAARREGAPDG